MKKRILFILILTFLSSACFADEYVLVMSKDDSVCQHMLKLYNEDLRKYGEVKYDEHEEFKAIKWEEKKYYTTFPDGKKHYPMTPPATVLISSFDINNDGTEEIVVKEETSFKSNITEQLFYFSGSDADSFKAEFDKRILYTKAVGKVGTGTGFEGGRYQLKELPKYSIGMVLDKETYSFYGFGPWFCVNPFIFKGNSYITLSENHLLIYKWLLILKFTRDNQLNDTCYFLKTLDCNKSRRRK